MGFIKGLWMGIGNLRIMELWVGACIGLVIEHKHSEFGVSP